MRIPRQRPINSSRMQKWRSPASGLELPRATIVGFLAPVNPADSARQNAAAIPRPVASVASCGSVASILLDGRREPKGKQDTPGIRLSLSPADFVGWKLTHDARTRQVDKLSEKAHDYENLLKDLGNTVEARTADRIKSLLDKVRFLFFFFSRENYGITDIQSKVWHGDRLLV